MIDAINVSKSGMVSSQNWLDTISHNLSNIQTEGYKRKFVNFESVINSASSEGRFSGLGSSSGDALTSFDSGDVRGTGRELDVYLDGSGFFEVITPNNEIGYTKNGRLVIGNDRSLSLIGGSQFTDMIFVPENVLSVEINTQGKVFGVLSADESVELGELSQFTFTNPEYLEEHGSGIYLESAKSGRASAIDIDDQRFGRVNQGYIELSNVKLVDEMSNLMLAQRTYQMNARVLQAADQILETINNIRR